MLLWYVGLSVLLVLYVFRSVGVDYRLVAAGSLLPSIVDAPVGRPAAGHTLLLSASVLAVVMLGTIGRGRLVRRRWICVPIGMLCGLLLSGAWLHTGVLWWPFTGRHLPAGSLLPAWWVVLLEELAGLVACWWVVGACDLYLPEPRRVFWRTGRLRITAEPEVGG